MAELMSLDRTKLWALFRLRGKLTLRQFSREPGKIVGAILAAIVFVPLVLGAAVGTTIGYLRLPEPWPAQLLGGVLVVLWLIWLVFPIFFASLNEGLDLTRLLVYPLTRRDLVASVLLGTLFDYPTYLMLPLFVAIFIGWGLSPALPVVLVAMALSYGHMVLISQLVVTAVGGILQSRRFRDISIIIASLFGASCYFLQTIFGRVAESLAEDVGRERLLALRPLQTLQWLPPGAAARAVERASAGAWGMSMLWLLYTAVLLLVVAWAWWRLVVRLKTGEGFLLSLPPVAEKQRKEEAARSQKERNWLIWLPTDVAQLAAKELRSVWRTPQRRVGMLQGVLMPFIMTGAILVSGDGPMTLPSWAGAGLPFYGLFLFWVITQNMLSWEGRGLPMLLLTPVPRRRIFLAKGLALTLTAGLPFLVISAVVIGLTREWLSVASMLTGLNMGIAAISVTAVFSVRFPVPINLESGRLRGSFSTGGGCAAGLVNAVLLPMLIGVVSLPAGLPLALAYWLRRPWIGFLGVVLGLVYAVTLFWFGSRLAGDMLLQREAEVVEALRLPEHQD